MTDHNKSRETLYLSMDSGSPTVVVCYRPENWSDGEKEDPERHRETLSVLGTVIVLVQPCHKSVVSERRVSTYSPSLSQSLLQKTLLYELLSQVITVTPSDT